LKIDFSSADRSPNITADQAFKRIIAQALREFYDTYAMYLGGDVPETIDPTYPALNLGKCDLLVNTALRDARQRGDRALADVQGVKMTSLVLLILTTEYLSTDLPPR
jgi:hypothetical protein